MWRSILLITLFLTLTGCVQYDSETLTISLNPGVDTVEVNSVFIDSGAKATLGNKTHRVNVVENNVDITKVGTYTITYETTYIVITRRVTRFVSVVDELPPVMTLNPGIDTVLLNEGWVDAGITAIDNSLLEVYVTVQGDVITSTVGEYQITYIAIDKYNNKSEAIRYVNVVDLP